MNRVDWKNQTPFHPILEVIGIGKWLMNSLEMGGR